MRLQAGMKLAHYEIISPLGAGGMGEVYRARDVRLDRDVAIKVLPERLAGSPEARVRFEREAKVLAALSHPNLVAIFDVGTENGTFSPSWSSLPAKRCSICSAGTRFRYAGYWKSALPWPKGWPWHTRKGLFTAT
jgi:serine/threonine protein kinase